MTPPIPRTPRRLLRQMLGGLAAAGVVALGMTAPALAESGGPAPAESVPSAPTESIASAAVAAGRTSDAPAPVPRLEPGDLATAPYMGWSSFSLQVYTSKNDIIDAAQLMAQSDAMHAKLQKFGYDHINVDAGWNDGFDEHGRPKPSAEHFPDGIEAVIDHVHDNGQKFGLYFIPGIGPEVYEAALPILDAPGCTTHDIVKQPLQQADYWDLGYALDFENPCAAAWVDSVGALLEDWGVDFVKFDSVTPGSGISDLSLDARADVAAWSKSLHSRGIWFELSWALDPAYSDYWREHADGWRVDWDVEAYAPGDAMVSWETISRLFPKAATWWRETGPGGFGDYDSLNVGNGNMNGLTIDERRTATTLWAIQAAPMYTGDDMTKLDKVGLELLTNPEVIAINQSATPARPVSMSTQQQTWYALHDDGSYTVALFNLGRTGRDMTVPWKAIGLSENKAKVRDVWARKNLGTFTDGFTAEAVQPHAVRLLTVTPAKGATSRLNDDTIQIGYQGDWRRNGGDQATATTQDLAVKVVASGGDTTPPADTTTRLTTLNNSDSSIIYEGGWSRNGPGRGLGDIGDDVAFAEQNGASFTVPFTGSGIQYITEKDASQGEVEVYLDDELKATVDTSLPAGTPRQSQQVVWEIADLEEGPHTLRVVKKSGDFMLLDAVKVRQQNLLVPNAVVIERGKAPDTEVVIERGADELASIARDGAELEEGTDYTITDAAVVLKSSFLSALPEGDTAIAFSFRGDRDDDVHTGTGDAWTDLTFTGTAVSWLAPTAPDQGKVKVFVDGRLAKTVDTHSDSRRTEQKLFSVDGLKRGTHRIVVQNAGDGVIRSDGFSFTR
ncbi:X2-like carbohydrate binding domain-containing protein [Microbacterium sp. JZ31]|uniref:X2-like carbohydrate binding domain-containing protein n=1 Tax=Microbacterium sp. JZ31 TaxID=1906274 RepID=UPI001931D812|nr:X2-like carbohydrate binding domain-containing protein [Microbacterium sp. JZ31]